MQFEFDPDKQDHLAPADIRSPYHFAEGGYANSFDPPMNTESQINDISQTNGGRFSGMGNQFSEPRPSLAKTPLSSMPSVVPNSPASNPNAYLMGSPNASAQSNELIPSQNQINQTQIPTYTPPTQDGNTSLTQDGNTQPSQTGSSPLASFAKGGSVGMDGLISTIKSEFQKRGLDFDKVIAARLAYLSHQKSQ